jgi:hypothetical protein
LIVTVRESDIVAPRKILLQSSTKHYSMYYTNIQFTGQAL